MKKRSIDILNMVNEEFIISILKGNSKNISLFYDYYSPYLYTTIYRYVSNIQDTEDLLQDTLIKILESLKNFTFTNEQMFKSWMIKIAINNALNFIRQKSKFDTIDDFSFEYLKDDETEDEETPIHELSPKELFSLITELPIGYKTVFNLFVLENYSHKEIANLLNISENTSKTQLLKARKLLKNKIEQKYSYIKKIEYGKV
ncbi:MAG: putative polymerase ECF-type sigma factor [Bacteroidetes bacterium]|nr:putative polymerase ECF-type sigma factor [Bacteroidota bacterium]